MLQADMFKDSVLDIDCPVKSVYCTGIKIHDAFLIIDNKVLFYSHPFKLIHRDTLETHQAVGDLTVVFNDGSFQRRIGSHIHSYAISTTN